MTFCSVVVVSIFQGVFGFNEVMFPSDYYLGKVCHYYQFDHYFQYVCAV